MWGLGLGSLALGLVNGALVISAGIGLVAYQQLLQLSPQQRKGLMQRLQQGLPLPAKPQQQALMLGLLAGASTYTFTSLWHSTHSLLMALLLTGQGALALFAVGALLRSSRRPTQGNDPWDANPMAPLEHNLAILSHSDPLRRLVAVRRLVRLAEQGTVDEPYGAGVSVRSHLIDCFRLMLSQEPETIVQSALREGLTLLQPTHSLPAASAIPFVPNIMADAVPDVAPEFAPRTTEPAPRIAPEVASALSPTASTRPAPASQGRKAAVEYVEYLEI